jgi:hypothetical protein
MAHHANAPGIYVVTGAEPRERCSSFVQLLILEQLQLHAIAAFDSFGPERARQLIPV